MYLLLDTNVTVGYYLARGTRSAKVRDRITNIFDSVRSGQTEHFFYLPNFCVAEVFSTFMKYSFGRWNHHVKKTIDTRVYRQLVGQFQSDIHNGKFIYHYELSRYHILGINLVAPVDHYFQHRCRPAGKKGPKPKPMGTFDQLIISMGIHLAHVHGAEQTVVVSADERLTDILSKCRGGLNANTKRKLKLDKAEELTGRSFAPSTFPRCINLQHASNTALAEVFGEWPLPVGKVPKVYRYLKP